MRLASFGFVTFLLASSFPTAAVAVPDPARCSVDPCLIVCPAGDIAFTVVVRDASNNPIANAFVSVDFCAGNVRRCDPLTVCQIGDATDATGRVVLRYMVGGISTTPVEVRADDVLIATRPIASPDQDGNTVVNGADVTIANSKLGMSDPTMDLDCDQGVVDQADLDVQQAHLNHACDNSTSIEARSWGRIKLLYR